MKSPNSLGGGAAISAAMILVLSLVFVTGCGGGSSGSGASPETCTFSQLNLTGAWTGQHTVTQSGGAAISGTQSVTLALRSGWSVGYNGFWVWTRSGVTTTAFLTGSCPFEGDAMSCTFSLGAPVTDSLNLTILDGCTMRGTGANLEQSSLYTIDLAKREDRPECPGDIAMNLQGLWIGDHEALDGTRIGTQDVLIVDSGCDAISGTWVWERAEAEPTASDFTAGCSNDRGSYMFRVGSDNIVATLIPEWCELTGTGTNSETGAQFTVRMTRASGYVL